MSTKAAYLSGTWFIVGKNENSPEICDDDFFGSCDAILKSEIVK